MSWLTARLRFAGASVACTFVWIVAGLYLCNPGQSCPSPTGFAVVGVLFDVLLLVAPQYLAVSWLMRDVASGVWLAVAFGVLTAVLVSSAPWHPGLAGLVVGCALIAAVITSGVRASESIRVQRFVEAAIMLVLFAFVSELLSDLPVAGPLVGIIAVTLRAALIRWKPGRPPNPPDEAERAVGWNSAHGGPSASGGF